MTMRPHYTTTQVSIHDPNPPTVQRHGFTLTEFVTLKVGNVTLFFNDREDTLKWLFDAQNQTLRLK